VKLLVVRLAQPNNVKRHRVIWVVGLGMILAAYKAGEPRYLANLYRAEQGGSGGAAVFEFPVTQLVGLALHNPPRRSFGIPLLLLGAAFLTVIPVPIGGRIAHAKRRKGLL
jgi:hypothetical protein